MTKPKIVFIHSLNNYTGSPNVLSVIVRGFIARGYGAEIITSRSKGFLSDIPNVRYRYTCYRWDNNRIMTFARLLLSQAGLFFRILFSSPRHIYYINTIVPVGAILACCLTQKRYIIHVHENMRQRKALYTLFRAIYGWCNTRSIFVSEYLKGTALHCRKAAVIYNALPQGYFNTASDFLKSRNKKGETILMVSSLRRFKGVYEFAELAKQMPQYPFELVLSATDVEVSGFAKEVAKPQNLRIYPTQTNLHPFYQRAKLVLQLSHPESWVETFGLTILEAMVYGIPSIVPNVGGPTELVKDNDNGFTVNPHQLSVIRKKIETLMDNEPLYKQFSTECLLKSRRFNEKEMINKIENYIQ